MGSAKKVSSPIRIDPALEEKIEEAAALTGLSKADVMRLAMKIGLEDLRRANFDVPAAVVDKAKPETVVVRKSVRYPSASESRPMPGLTLNEEPPPDLRG